MPTSEPLAGLMRLADLLQRAEPAQTVWAELDRALADSFGHKLFTLLVFGAEEGRLMRLYSTRPDISPLGGAKAVTDSPWTRQVLRAGQIYVGSTREDIRSVFSEYELLWSIGCESVLNIPVKRSGRTIGTLNLLDRAGRYDASDHPLALLFAQLISGLLGQCLDEADFGHGGGAALEHV